MTYMTKDQAVGGAMRMLNRITSIIRSAKDNEFDDTWLSQIIESVELQRYEEDCEQLLGTIRIYDREYRQFDNKGVYLDIRFLCWASSPSSLELITDTEANIAWGSTASISSIITCTRMSAVCSVLDTEKLERTLQEFIDLLISWEFFTDAIAQNKRGK